jgi:hypothetical protein
MIISLGAVDTGDTEDTTGTTMGTEAASGLVAGTVTCGVAEETALTGAGGGGATGRVTDGTIVVGGGGIDGSVTGVGCDTGDTEVGDTEGIAEVLLPSGYKERGVGGGGTGGASREGAGGS